MCHTLYNNILILNLFLQKVQLGLNYYADKDVLDETEKRLEICEGFIFNILGHKNCKTNVPRQV